MDAARLDGLLPWREPFRMIDRMLDCKPHEWIATAKRVTVGDPVVDGDGEGCLPAVLLLEGMSQSAALLYVLTYPDPHRADLPLLGFLEGRFDGTAAVGESVRYEVQARKMTRSGGVFVAEAQVDGRRIARAELAFAAGRNDGGG